MTEKEAIDVIDTVLSRQQTLDTQKRMAAEKAAKETPDELPANWQLLPPIKKMELGLRRSKPAVNPANAARG